MTLIRYNVGIWSPLGPVNNELTLQIFDNVQASDEEKRIALEVAKKLESKWTRSYSSFDGSD